jgi:Fe-S cluster assembly protein SufD
MAAVTGGLNVLCQAELGAGAVFGHLRVQAESDREVLLTSTMLEQAADSSYVYRGFDLGASLARHEITVRLAGEGATADIAGAFVLDGKRHLDNHVSVEHLAAGCRSEQFFRGVLGGRSRGVFNGRALIQPGADGSIVRQSNANLLLSPLAEMDTKPELEIYADEVEASHGATVGQLDEAAIFYLRSRGLDEAAARRMLTTAFCHAVTDRVSGRGLAERIAELLDAAMPTDTDV